MVPPVRVTRRQALGLMAGATVAAVLGACDPDESTTTSPTLSVAPTTTSVAPTSSPVDDLYLRLWAAPDTAEIVAGVTTDVYSFGAEVIEGDPGAVVASDSYLGPTLHFRQGQRVQVTFENRLDEECIVHWHGLYVPQNQDGQPAEAVGPGQTYEYDFVVTNDPGTYWYHPHPHGKTGEQVYRGLAGLLIIDDPEPLLPAGENDLALVLQDRTLNSDGDLIYVNSMHDRMAGFTGSTLVTNGVANFAVSVKREPYRIRFLNGANARTHYLQWSSGQPFNVMATDGIYVPETSEMPALVLTPAQRSDIWIDFSNLEAGTRFELLSTDTFVEGGSSIGSSGEVVASFTVEDSEPQPRSRPAALGAALAFGAADTVNQASPKQFVLSTRQAAHWINQTHWEGRAANDLETVQSNTIELWEFVNTSPLAHPMHLHGRAFRVVSRSWDSGSAPEAWTQIEEGISESGLRDTVLVWPGQRVQIAVPFGDLKGFFLYHCHILEHEDAGMMRNFQVV